MDTKKRSPIDRLLFATFLKGRTSSRDVWEEKGDMTPEDNQKIIEETNEIIHDDSTYPFISYLSDLLAKSKPSDEAVMKLHDCIEKVAVALGQDLSLIHISEPTRRTPISYAVFCLKKKKKGLRKG